MLNDGALSRQQGFLCIVKKKAFAKQQSIWVNACTVCALLGSVFSRQDNADEHSCMENGSPRRKPYFLFSQITTQSKTFS